VEKLIFMLRLIGFACFLPTVPSSRTFEQELERAVACIGLVAAFCVSLLVMELLK
jgi:Fe2+ transport system protein B